MDKRKYDKEGYCSYCGKQKGFSIIEGSCGELHERCTLCKREWCPRFNEYEQLSTLPVKQKKRANTKAKTKPTKKLLKKGGKRK